MDQLTYLADPRTSLQMHDSAHLEQVKTAEWRHARHVTDELVVRPRATMTSPWLSWRGALQPLRLAGSVR